MEFNNSVYPTKEQMDGFLEGDETRLYLWLTS